jgi:putative (di)nucleoside polyphosphate hydrolase
MQRVEGAKYHMVQRRPRKQGNMIDPDGFRPNVAIVIMKDDSQVFWAHRANNDGWQFPQGGMRSDETPVEAMYRELREETGLKREHVELLGSTPGWLRYRLPRRYQRTNSKPLCIGQKQVWFLLKLLSDESAVTLDSTDTPEFREYRWVDFWYPVDNVIEFKRKVYYKALSMLEPMAPLAGHVGSESI